jgi:hypothetical protein
VSIGDPRQWESILVKEHREDENASNTPSEPPWSEHLNPWEVVPINATEDRFSNVRMTHSHFITFGAKGFADNIFCF